MIILSTMMEMYLEIYLSLMVSMDYPFTTKTEQEKYEDSDSTFISSKFIQTVESKPISEWIIAVGVGVQYILDS